MVKHYDLKAALDFIRQGYSKSTSPFRFTVSDMAGAINSSEKMAKEILQTINTRAQFWRGNFPLTGDNFIVSSQVFERIKNWFK